MFAFLAVYGTALVLTGPAPVVQTYDHELRVAQQAAREAGALVNEYRGKVAAEKKAGGEVVTKADREAGKLIVDRLRRHFPADLFITEEDPSNWSKLRTAGRVWFIDPIDGTKDYVEGKPGFAVHIGLVEKWPLIGRGRPVVGVVYEPANDRMMFAAPLVGARMIERGQETRLRVSSRRALSSLRLLVSNPNRGQHTDQIKNALGIKDEAPMGSIGVKVGHLARNEHDITFKDDSRARLWDVAAPQAILEQAGGRFTTMTGKRFDYRRIQTEGGTLATNGVVHAEVVRKVRPLLSAKAAAKK